MKTAEEIRAMIKAVHHDYGHVLTGTIATLDVNAPRALMQIGAETKLETLHAVLGTQYKSKLKGRN